MGDWSNSTRAHWVVWFKARPFFFLHSCYFSFFGLTHFACTRMFGVCILNKKTLINLKHFVTSWCIKIWNLKKEMEFAKLFCRKWVCVCVCVSALIFQLHTSHQSQTLIFYTFFLYCGFRWFFFFIPSIMWYEYAFRIYNSMHFIWFGHCTVAIT